MGCVDVLVDASRRLGPLSYLCDQPLEAGVEVLVPFGAQQRLGVVVGAGDVERATRAVIAVTGVRAQRPEFDTAVTLAGRHFSSLESIAARFAPKAREVSRRRSFSAPSLTTGDDTLLAALRAIADRRRHLLCEPGADLALVAALQAVEMARDGQVLVLCPSKALVADVLALFRSGAARMDASGPASTFQAWRDGQLPVAVATRSCALYPAADLAGIIVVDERHPGHVEQQQPHTHAREVAALRAKARDCQLAVLAQSPHAPSMLSQKVHVVPSSWPTMTLLDVSDASPAQRWLPSQILARSALPTVLVCAPQPLWRCSRCSEVAPSPDVAARLRQVSSPVPCSRCGGKRVYRARLDAEHVIAASAGRVEPVSFADLAELTEPTRIVLPELDSWLSRPSLSPLADVLDKVLRAASHSHGGEVVAWSKLSDPSVRALFDRDLLTAARGVWDQARAALAPPFSQHVELVVSGRRPPPSSSWPGRVLGPTQLGDDWKFVIQLPAQDHDRLAAVITQLRRRRKVRVVVT